MKECLYLIDRSLRLDMRFRSEKAHEKTDKDSRDIEGRDKHNSSKDIGISHRRGG
jgi:hypothetical protein